MECIASLNDVRRALSVNVIHPSYDIIDGKDLADMAKFRWASRNIPHSSSPQYQHMKKFISKMFPTPLRQHHWTPESILRAYERGPLDIFENDPIESPDVYAKHAMALSLVTYEKYAPVETALRTFSYSMERRSLAALIDGCTVEILTMEIDAIKTIEVWDNPNTPIRLLVTWDRSPGMDSAFFTIDTILYYHPHKQSGDHDPFQYGHEIRWTNIARKLSMVISIPTTINAELTNRSRKEWDKIPHEERKLMVSFPIMERSYRLVLARM